MAGLPMTRDIIPDMGPLGASMQALAISRPRALVVAADMPFLQSEPCKGLRPGDHQQMVILLGGHRALHALYQRPAFPKSSLVCGPKRRIAALTEQVPHLTVPRKSSPHPHEIFFNMNTLKITTGQGETGGAAQEGKP